jgi:CBS domain-containing protein
MKSLQAIVSGHDPLVLAEDMSVLEAARFMSEKRIGAVPVLSGDRLVGVFSERDLMTRVFVPGLDARSLPLRDVMTKNLVVADASDTIPQAIAKMRSAHCRHLPVVLGGKLIAFISLRDLLEVERTEKDEEIQWMTQYIQYVPPRLK